MTYDDRHHEHFEEHGYVRLGQLLSASELSALRERIDALMLGRIATEGITFQLDGEGRVDELHQDDLFLAYMQHPVCRQIPRQYIGEDVSVFRSMFMNKPANSGTVLPWHQDVGVGWGLDRNPTTTVWTALDDATTATGCMQIVPGSHRLGVLNEGHYTLEEDQAFHCTDDKVMDFEVEAGEAILIHNWLLHRSGVNGTDRPRRAFSVAYMPAATTTVSTGERFPVIFGKGALQ